jgi:hypothetical protein
MLPFILFLVGFIAVLYVVCLVVNLLVHGAGSVINKVLHKRDRLQGDVDGQWSADLEACAYSLGFSYLHESDRSHCVALAA